jgi:folate-binding protein YgfZ
MGETRVLAQPVAWKSPVLVKSKVESDSDTISHVDQAQVNHSRELAATEARADHAGYDAAVRAAAVAVLADRIVVRVSGDDRAAFLHGMCSADLKGAAAGAILPALFLTEHAHVIAEFFAWVLDDAILIETSRAQWARAREHLERLLVADDVEFDDGGSLAVIDVEGAEAPAAIRAVFGDSAAALADWHHIRAPDDGAVGRFPRFGAAAYSVLAPRARAADVAAHLAAAVAGGRQIDASVTEIIRVEHGIAAVGIDTTDKTLALEARMERAIAPGKGCYVGQETIERATARGGLKKRLQGLRLRSVRDPAPGAALRLGGKEVGRVTSAVNSPRLGPIGLAILHHSAWQPGCILELLPGGGSAEVSDLPFS